MWGTLHPKVCRVIRTSLHPKMWSCWSLFQWVSPDCICLAFSKNCWTYLQTRLCSQFRCGWVRAYNADSIPASHFPLTNWPFKQDLCDGNDNLMAILMPKLQLLFIVSSKVQNKQKKSSFQNMISQNSIHWYTCKRSTNLSSSPPRERPIPLAEQASDRSLRS